MSIKRKKITEIQKEEAPGIVLYELTRFCFAANILLNKQRFSDWSETQRKMLGSSLRDSVLLHARNLHDFFAKGRGREDDMVAGDFVPSKEDDNLWKSKMPKTAELITKMDKLRNHLTYERVGNDFNWKDTEHIPTIKSEVKRAYTDFLQLLPESERVHWNPRTSKRAKEWYEIWPNLEED